MLAAMNKQKLITKENLKHAFEMFDKVRCGTILW